jgi:hypothetical protein
MRLTIGRRHRALRPPRGRASAPLRWLCTGELLVALALGLGLGWCAASWGLSLESLNATHPRARGAQNAVEFNGISHCYTHALLRMS